MGKLPTGVVPVLAQALSDMHFTAPRLRVLDERGRLAPAADVAYNDAPWMPEQAQRFIHPKLSNEAGAPPAATAPSKSMVQLSRTAVLHATCCGMK